MKSAPEENKTKQNFFVTENNKHEGKNSRVLYNMLLLHTRAS